VTVSGPRSLILEMTNRAITRQVDLSSATPGTMVISNTNNSIPVPRGITVLRVQPASVILSLDKLIQKHFPVKPVVSGKIEAGYILKRMKMDPEVITITGPQTILSQMDELRTHEIVIDGLSESQQRQVPLKLDPEIVELIGETSVTAFLQVAYETVERTIRDVPVVAILDGVQQHVKPGKVTVTANIAKNLIKEKADLKKLFTATAIDVLGDGRLKVTIVPREDLKESVEILAVEPDYVEILQEKSERPVESAVLDGENNNGGDSPAAKSKAQGGKPPEDQTRKPAKIAPAVDVTPKTKNEKK